MAEAAWTLARELVDEGLRDDAIPSLARLGELGQIGDLPALIAELARQLEQPDGLELAARVRAHAHEREAIGFAPREIVAEFLLLRRVLWRFVSRRISEFQPTDVLEIERRLNDTIDRLVTECVVAYFEQFQRAIARAWRRRARTRFARDRCHPRRTTGFPRGNGGSAGERQLHP